MLRLYVPTKGEILLNSINYLEYDLSEYYGLFSTVFQDFVLFAYTLRENIMFDDEINDLNKRKFLATLEKTGFGDKLKNLSNGMDTYITQEYSEDGESLSGGESQRVAIARAWYKESPIIIMDEPTSAINPISEEKLFDSVSEFFAGRTAILISHRMSSVRLLQQDSFL